MTSYWPHSDEHAAVDGSGPEQPARPVQPCYADGCELDAGERGVYCPKHLGHARRDLRAIVDLVRVLRDLPEYRPSHDRVGGPILDMLGPIADRAGRERQHHRQLSYAADRIGWDDAFDDACDSPLWVLVSWEDLIRAVLEQPTALTASEERAADYLEAKLGWANTTANLDLSELADDLRRVKTRLENLLGAGRRVVRGIVCRFCGVALLRVYTSTGLTDDWKCPRCKREFNDQDYATNQRFVSDWSRTVDIDARLWAPAALAAGHTGVNEWTIRKWMQRGRIAVACLAYPDLRPRGELYICIDEVDKHAARRGTVRSTGPQNLGQHGAGPG